MLPMRIVRPAFLLLVGLATAGCGVASVGTMVPLPPAPDWNTTLESDRKTRDDFFRESPGSPLLAEDVAGFGGLDYWAPDPVFHFVGPLNRHAAAERLTLVTTAGKTRPAEKYGWIRFPLGGRELTLQVYRLLDNRTGDDVEAMLVPFQDATTGKETYPAGRYVNLVGNRGGPYVLDFNRAYNPSCAYGDPKRFACPVTPSENKLPLAIPAGERGFKETPPAGG